jgi:hypothetical protein
MADEPTSQQSKDGDPPKKDDKKASDAVGITAEELKKTINEAKEEARKEEKNKLYKDLKKTEDKIGEMKTLYDQIKKEKDDKEKELDAERKAKMTMEEKIEEMRGSTEQAFDDLGKKFEEQFSEQVKSVKELEGKLENSKLEAHKERRLRELSEENIGFIPELITGSSKEDMDKSIENSIKKFKSLAEKIRGEKIEGENFKFPTVTSPSTPPGEGDDDLAKELSKLRPKEEGEFLNRLKTLSDSRSEEFKKLADARDKIKERLKQDLASKGRG